MPTKLERVAWDWTLNEESVIWMVGAYSGKALRRLWGLFHCRIYALEPQLRHCARLWDEFADNPKVHLLPVAMGETSGLRRLKNTGKDSASIIELPPQRISPGLTRDALMLEAGFLVDLYCAGEQIDLMHMNCEGYEYILLPHFARTGFMDRIDRLMVTWHVGWKGKPSDAAMIAALEPTHRLVWSAESWQGWVRKGVRA